MERVRSSIFLKCRPVFYRACPRIFSMVAFCDRTGLLTRTFPRGCWEKRKYTPLVLFSSISTSRRGRRALVVSAGIFLSAGEGRGCPWGGATQNSFALRKKANIGK